ncbi:MAG: hypothetical protein KAS32_20010 [Candidatus Peribacteraceae bacterium]|nr:hypothetical protein [Candidatus Peribacteraceae bacterium]
MHPNKCTGSKKSATKIKKELRSFKRKLHKLVDRTKIRWMGEPWEKGSEYYFIVHNDLIQLMAMISGNVLDDIVEEKIVNQAEEVKKAIENKSK